MTQDKNNNVDNVGELLGSNDDPWMQIANESGLTYYDLLVNVHATKKPASQQRLRDDIIRYHNQVEHFVDAGIADDRDYIEREHQIEVILRSPILSREELTYKRPTPE